MTELHTITKKNRKISRVHGKVETSRLLNGVQMRLTTVGRAPHDYKITLSDRDLLRLIREMPSISMADRLGIDGYREFLRLSEMLFAPAQGVPE